MGFWDNTDTVSIDDFEEIVQDDSLLDFHGNITQPVEWSPLEEKIDHLKLLQKFPENWDGYGAIPPDQRAITNSEILLEVIPYEYQKLLNLEDISLTPYGTIVMEWYNYNYNISVEVGNNLIGYLSETPDNENPFKESARLDTVVQEITSILEKVFLSHPQNTL